VDVTARSAQPVLYVRMSDRATWLEKWCPTCRSAPGARCRTPFHRTTRPPTRLHVSRGWRIRRCPTCGASAGEPFTTPSGPEASAPHTARLRLARDELLLADAVFAELDRLDAIGATVPFGGRAGASGQVGRVVLSRLEGESGWNPSSARQARSRRSRSPRRCRTASDRSLPAQIMGPVRWETADRRVLISGRRGCEPFEERV
jgi:hypothetical protein